jgi:hypothetical protein
MRLALILVAALGAVALFASVALHVQGYDTSMYLQLASTVVGVLGGVVVAKNT